MSVVPFPTLATLWPWKPPSPPFSWRLADFGPVKIEMLHDSLGRQVFRGNVAVQGRTIPKKEWMAGGAS